MKYVCFNLCALFFAFFVYEAYGYYNSIAASDVKLSGTFADNPLVSGIKDQVGYGPKEDTTFSVTAVKKVNDNVVYNVTYTFENGLRKTPQMQVRNKNYFLFLGCSFVFGDGLNDNQTLPYYFSKLSKERFKVINFGFSGYGTHQALKITEEKIVKDALITQADSVYVLYSFIPEHFLRAAGKLDWDAYGPWYELEQGTLLHKGSFNDKTFFKQNYFTKRIKVIWHSSNLFKSFFYPTTTKEDVVRVVEMIKAMNTRLNLRKIHFLLLINQAEVDRPNCKLLIDELHRHKIKYFLIDSVIPDISSNFKNYFIPDDGHPNPIYNQKVASYLLSKLIIAKTKL